MSSTNPIILTGGKCSSAGTAIIVFLITLSLVGLGVFLIGYYADKTVPWIAKKSPKRAFNATLGQGLSSDCLDCVDGEIDKMKSDDVDKNFKDLCSTVGYLQSISEKGGTCADKCSKDLLTRLQPCTPVTTEYFTMGDKLDYEIDEVGGEGNCFVRRNKYSNFNVDSGYDYCSKSGIATLWSQTSGNINC